jgi:preprotein translocase subunit SecG
MTKVITNKKVVSFKKINKTLVKSIVVLIVLFFASQILITAVLSTRTTAIDDIRRKKDELRLQNEILTAQIDKAKTISSSQALIEKYKLTGKEVNFLNDVSNDDLAYEKTE